jgi:hypothetical protein
MAFTALNNRPQAQTVPVQVPVPQSTATPAPHPQEIDVAFAGNHELRKRVHAAIGMLLPPHHAGMYANIKDRPESYTKHFIPRHIDIHPESKLTDIATPCRTRSQEAQTRRQQRRPTRCPDHRRQPPQLGHQAMALLPRRQFFDTAAEEVYPRITGQEGRWHTRSRRERQCRIRHCMERRRSSLLPAHP